MKKLIYIANIRLPTEKAHGIQIMKTCEAFANLGHKVELVVPRRFNFIKEDPFEYYDVEKNFNIVKLPSLDLVKFGRIGFWVQSFLFAQLAFFYSMLCEQDVVYSRDELPIYLLSFFKKNVFWESHIGKFNFITKKLIKKCKGIIAITKGLKDFYTRNGIAKEKIFVAPDGVDLRKFIVGLSKEECRDRLNLPKGKKIIAYTGHLYKWKGANILADSASFFGNEYLFVFVGGTFEDVKKFKEKYSDSRNILIIGQKPHSEIPYYLKSADILVLPNSAQEKISRLYTSPMKMFEYMASGVPIIASDLPSIREILSSDNAILVKSDDPEDLSNNIYRLLKSITLSGNISSKSLKDVVKYTWESRASNILDFIKFNGNSPREFN